MNDAKFSEIIKLTHQIAQKHICLIDLVNEECEKRYGCSYNDACAESIIDSLDYGQGVVDSLVKFDEAMKLALKIET